MPEKSQNKTNLQQCISIHIALPQIIPIQKNTQALKMMFPAAQNDKAKNAKKSHKKKPATVHFTNYYPSTNYTFTKRHKVLNIIIPATQNDYAKNVRKKAKNKTNLQQ